MGQVVVAACGRFHLFDQARELYKRNLLKSLITDYPPWYPDRYGVPPEKVKSFLLNGIIKYGLASSFIPSELTKLSSKFVHDAFSKRLARNIPAGTKILIGLSSFTLDALIVCRDCGIRSIIDHGSLHQQVERDILLEAGRRWGLKKFGELPPNWIIEKQAQEYEEADNILVLSKAAFNSMESMGIPTSKLKINPCGVNTSHFTPGVKSDRVFRVLQVAAISLRKGTLDLLEAFKLARMPNSELCFVGSHSHEIGLNDIIGSYRFLNPKFCNPVPQQKLLSHYQNSSVFVLASLADGFGMVVPQAMACGLPVIVTNNVGAADLVNDGVNGFVVPAGRPDVISDRLRLLNQSPDLLASMGLAASKTILDGYSWSHYGERLSKHLTSLGYRG